MTRLLDRRHLLAALVGLPVAGALLSVADRSHAEDQKASKPAVEAPKPEGSVDVKKLMAPEALPDMSMGKSSAPVTVVEYASMTCPHCAEFDIVTFPAFKKKYIDTGKVYYILREFPFDPRAEAGFMLARCSKDKYFAMVDLLFHQQDNWAAANDAKAALLQLSKLAGFTQESFTACLTDQKLLDQIRSVKNRAEKDFGVDATPTFFINGKKYPGAMSIDEMSAIIDPLV
ncbi:MAG TPA: DsbA family protein [Rhizobiaceae bacterium]|nr:DsbA family protein [Rhizobiaceae bacterium]